MNGDTAKSIAVGTRLRKSIAADSLETSSPPDSLIDDVAITRLSPCQRPRPDGHFSCAWLAGNRYPKGKRSFNIGLLPLLLSA
jgi:hypothetical protein